MVTIPNTITQQSQGNQSEPATFQLTLASTAQTNSFTAIRDGLKTTTATIAKPVTIQQQQLQQSLSKMQGIVFANTIQLQQPQLQAAKLQRQLTTQQQQQQQQNTSKTTTTTVAPPLTARTIQRKIQIPQAPPPQIIVRRQSVDT